MKKKQTLILLAAIASTAALPMAAHASAFTDPTSGQMVLWVNTITGDVELVGNNTTIVGYQISSSSQSLIYANWTKPITHSTTGWTPAPASGGYLAEVTSSSSYAVTTQDTHPYDMGDIFNPAAAHDLVLHFTSLVNGSASYVLGAVEYGAPTLTWDPGLSPTTPGSDGAGNWDTTTAIWSNGSTDQTWTNGFAASIGANGTGNTITIDTTGISATGITFNPLTTGQYTIASAASGDNLTLSGTITLNANATISAPIVGSGAITIVGPDTLTLSGTNTYSGGTTLDSGTLAITQDAAIPTTGALTFAGGTLQLNNYTSSLNFSNENVQIGAATGTAATLAGVIGGTSLLTYDGPGTLILTGANTYSLGTLVNAGTLEINTGGTLGNGSGLLTIQTGATVQVNTNVATAGLSGAGSLVLNTSGTGYTANDTTINTFSGVISGVGNFTQAGTGTEILSGANTYTGTTTISGGTLEFTGDTSGLTGGIADNASLDMAQTANSSLAGVISGSGTLIDNGAAGTTLTLSGANTFTGGITLNSGILSVSSEGNLGGAANPLTFNGGELLSTAAFLTDSRTITLDAASGTTVDIHGGQDSFSGVISGSGALTVLDSAPTANSSITLSGANTYTGGTVLNNSHMIITADNNLGSSTGTITLNSAQLETRGLVNTARNIVLAGTGDILNSYNEVESFSGVISGAGPVTVTNFGGGVLAFSGANTYTGGTIIQDGILAVSTDANLGASSGNITLQGGTLKTLASLTTARSVVLASGGSSGPYIDTDGAHTDTFSGVISGTTSLNIEDSTLGSSGKVIFSGANTYAGLTKISNGTLALSGTGTIADSSYLQILTGAVFDISATASGATVKSFGGYGNINLGAEPLAETITSGNVADFDGVMSGTGSLTLSGTGGTQYFKGINTYTGATIINDGTLALSHGGSIAASSGVTLNLSTSVLDITQATSGETIKALSGSLGTVALGSQTLTISGTGSSTFDGVIQNSGISPGTGGGLTVSGGTETLSGANVYTGATTITGGTLSLSGTGSIVDSSGVVLGSGGTFDISGTTGGATIVGLTGSGGTVNLGGKTLSLALSTSQTDTFNGIIEGTGGGLTLSGTSATEILGGTNTYSGTTTITSGTLEFTGSTANLTGGIVNNSNLNFQQTANSSFSGVISGTGTVTQDGSAATTLTLSGANTDSGVITITAGTLKFTGSTAGLGGNLIDNSALVFGQTASSSLTGIISGTGTVTQAGAPGTTLTLAGNNTYSGATTVSAGTLELSGLTAGLTGGIVDNSALVFQQAANNSLSGVISGSGTVTENGASGTTLTLSGANTYSGITTISSGTLDLAGTTGGMTGNIVDNSSLAFVQTASSSLSGIISGTGGVTEDGSAGTTLTLSGANTYSGTTTITSGTLEYAGSTASLTGGIVNNSALVFHQAASSTLSSAISGTGSLTENGSAGTALTLTGANTYTGPTTISSGSLNVGTGGSLAHSNITIDSGASLGGTGTITWNLSNNTGDLISNSGTLNITGLNLILNISGTQTQSQYILANDASGILSGTRFATVTGLGSGTIDYTGTTLNPNDIVLVVPLTLSWDPLANKTISDGSGNWDTTNTNATWALAGADQAWSNGSSASIGADGGTSETITIDAGPIVVSNLSFNAMTSGAQYTIAGTGANTLEVDGTISLANNATISAALVGSLPLTITGTHTLTLTGTNTYTGGTTLENGVTVNFNNASAFGTGSITVGTGGATLQYNAASLTIANNLAIAGGAVLDTNGLGDPTSGVTYAGNITGAGGLTVTSSVAGGELYLTGNNSAFTGNTTLLSGVEAGFNTSTSFGSGTVTIGAGGGTLEYTANLTVSNRLILAANGGINAHGTTSTWAGVISGTGGLLVHDSIGDGILTLSAINTYSGATTIGLSNTVTLALSGTGSISSSSYVGTVAGATFDVSQVSAGTVNIRGLKGTGGTIALGSKTLDITGSGTYTYSGVIQNGGIGGGTGAGLALTGTGLLTLTGANTYTGVTAINSGELLLSTGGSIADSSNVSLASGAKFDISQTTSGATVNGLTGSGGYVYTGAETLTVNVAGTDSFGGEISDSGGVNNVRGGGLTKTGSGTLTVTGFFDNYSGATTISAGTLAVSASAGDFDDSSNIAIASGATLDISAVSGETAHSITGLGTVALGSTSLELFAASGSYTFGGLIKDGGISGGTGGSLIIGVLGTTATTILTGANTYTGSTTITSGTLGLSGTGSIADSSGVILDTGGTANSTFDLSALTTGSASIKSLASASVGTGSGTASVLLGTNSLTLTNASGSFAGVISGTGGLGINAGTQTLTGVNTYSDVTSVSGGTLALSGTGSVADSSRIALSPGGTFDISATTSGATVLGLAGIGGTVNLGSKTLSVTLPTSQTDTFNGIIEGVGGGLTLSGTSATEILGGTNTYSGTTTITSGTLEFAGSTASLTGGIVNNSALLFHQTASSSLSSAISGTGGVTENGSVGTALTLTGANTYSGPTTITSGALDIGTGGSLAHSNITIDSGASLGGIGSLTWNLIGNSSDLIANSGNINLTGLNLILNITGTQTQSQYVLADDTSGTLTGTHFASVTGLGSGAIDYTGTTLHPNDIVLVVPLTLSWDGATVKAGLLSDGSGNWDTTNTNATWALAGADQAWSNGSSASIGADGGTSETITIDAGPIVVSNLSFNAMTSGAQYTIAGTGANTLEVDGTISLANNATISASLVGSNPLTVTGAHTLTLSGVNTYTGGTTLENGVTVNFNNASAFSSGAITIGTGGASLQFGAAGLTLSNAVTLNSNATVDLNNLTGETYSGAITNTGSSNSLMVINGTMQLTGTNSSTFSAGNLIVGNGTAASVAFTSAANLPGAGAGIELNAGSLVYSGASAVTISNTITNTGASAQDGINAGAQIVTLSGALANSSAGATIQLVNGTFVLASNQGSQFSSGTLELGNNGLTTLAEFSSSANLIASAATVSLNQAELKYTGNAAATLASGLNITGTGPDILDAGGGGGVLTIAGNLTDATSALTLQNGSFILAGPTTSGTFTGGNLIIGNGGSVNTNVGFSSLTNLPATGITLTLNNGTLTDLAASGAGLNISNPLALSGTGSFVDAGSGTQAHPTILSSAISGSSGFTVSGASDSDYIAVSNANTGYSGNFTINGGAVIQENAAAFGTGNLLVSGGELVSTTVATNGSTATTLHVAGNYTQTSGGGLALAIVSPTSADTLTVTGTAALGGTLLLDVNAAAVPAIAQRVNYTLITAGSPITGNFANYAFAPGSATAVSFSGVDVGNTYVLTLLGGFNFALNAQNPNQLAIANYIDTAANNPGINPTLQSLLLSLSGQSPQDIANALNQMLPLVYGGLANMQINNSVFNSEAINGQISSDFDGGGFNTAGLTLLKTTNTDPFSLALASALQSNSTVNAATSSTQYLDDVMHANSGNVPLPSRESARDAFGGFIAGQAILGSQPTDSSGENYFTGGLNTGLDYRFAKSLVVGLSFNYSYTGAHLDALGSTLRDNSYAPGLFAGYRRGNFFADASTDYTYNQYTIHRNVTLGGASSTATGKPDSNQFDLNTMVGFNFPIFRHFKAGPALGLDYTHISMSSFSETGSPADLNVGSQSVDSLRSLLGGQAQYKLRLPKVPMPLVISANAFWQHEYLNNSRGISSSLSGLGGGTFITNIPNAGRDSALLGAGVSGKICPNATLFANYEAQIGPNNQHSQSIMVGMAVQF